MRKKSHISLARFLVKGLNNDILYHRRKAFYVGSLLPDCRPSFLTMRHEYDETFRLVEKKLRRLTQVHEPYTDSMRYMIDLGQVLHYIADYFTFPHNSHYPGGLKEHCKYEEYLKRGLRTYIREGNAVFHSEETKKFASAEDILAYIRVNHSVYMKSNSTVEEDCEYITRVCSQVLAAIAYLVSTPADTVYAA